MGVRTGRIWVKDRLTSPASGLIQDLYDASQVSTTRAIDVLFERFEGLMSDERFDVILCDLHMPGMDGYKIAQRFKLDPRLAAIPLVSAAIYPRMMLTSSLSLTKWQCGANYLKRSTFKLHTKTDWWGSLMTTLTRLVAFT